MSAVEWGPAIEVAGVRPAWLANDVEIQWIDTAGLTQNLDNAKALYWGKESNGVTQIESIRLLDDHFAYTAIAKGFEPWGGGDNAPEDWDGTDNVILRNGNMGDDVCVTDWSWCDEEWDIIGYRKIQPVAAYADSLSADEVRAIVGGFDAANRMIAALQIRHQLREPTKAERITTKTGLTVEQVQSVLDAMENN